MKIAIVSSVVIVVIIIFYVFSRGRVQVMGDENIKHVVLAPDTAKTNEPILIQVILTTIKNNKQLSARFTDILLHYKLTTENTYSVVEPFQMPYPDKYQIMDGIPSTDYIIKYGFYLPLYPIGTHGEIEYYIDMKFDGKPIILEEIKRIILKSPQTSSKDLPVTAPKISYKTFSCQGLDGFSFEYPVFPGWEPYESKLLGDKYCGIKLKYPKAWEKSASPGYAMALPEIQVRQTFQDIDRWNDGISFEQVSYGRGQNSFGVDYVIQSVDSEKRPARVIFSHKNKEVEVFLTFDGDNFGFPKQKFFDKVVASFVFID